MVKLILRDNEYEVRPGMTLLSTLEKCGILSESVIATREGELILDDEIVEELYMLYIKEKHRSVGSFGLWEASNSTRN